MDSIFDQTPNCNKFAGSISNNGRALQNLSFLPKTKFLTECKDYFMFKYWFLDIFNEIKSHDKSASVVQ
jgi:hypothetical protein